MVRSKIVNRKGWVKAVFKGEWRGNNIPSDNKILILGESHYGNEIDDAGLTTTKVVYDYLDYNAKGERTSWTPFFDKIAKSFGYPVEKAEEFYSKVYFGNYIEVFCGIKEKNKAPVIVKDPYNRTRYNDSLFRFINENGINTIVCFSILAFNNMPGRASSEEKTKYIIMGEVGTNKNGKKDIAREYVYLPDVEHKFCNVVLKSKLRVLAVRHPSCNGGFNAENVGKFLQENQVEV